MNMEGQILAENVLVLDITGWTVEIFASRLSSILIRWNCFKYGFSVLFQKWSPLTVLWDFTAIFCNHYCNWWGALFNKIWTIYHAALTGGASFPVRQARQDWTVMALLTVQKKSSSSQRNSPQHGVEQTASIAELLNYQSFYYAVAYSAASVRWQVLTYLLLCSSSYVDIPQKAQMLLCATCTSSLSAFFSQQINNLIDRLNFYQYTGKLLRFVTEMCCLSAIDHCANTALVLLD